MKNFYKTIKVFLFAMLSIALVSSAVAEPNENAKTKVELQAEEANEVEFYDYHSGITYTRTLYNFVHRHLNKNSIELDKKHVEPTSQ